MAEQFLPPALQTGEPLKNPLLLPPLSLAYLGDTIYEVFIRNRLLRSGKVKVNDLHRAAIKYVRASGQAQAVSALAPLLDPEEADVVRRGRNAKGHAAPKNADPKAYNAATGFEALVGYLYLAGRYDRLQELLELACRSLEEASQ